MSARPLIRFVAVFALVVLATVNTTWAVTPQGSTYYFPQVVDGRSGNTAYSSIFSFTNTQTTENLINIYFYRTDGTPWAIDLRSFDRTDISSHVSMYVLFLAPGETVNLFTGAVEAIGVGWALVRSYYPLVASEVFQLQRSNSPLNVVWEAGVLPSSSSTRFSFTGNVSANEPTSGTNSNTGYAIANPSDSSAVIRATLHNRVGVQVSEKIFSLGANCQTAEYLNQLFDSYTFPAVFHGHVRFSSNVNIILVALRNLSGPTGDVFSTIGVNPDYTLDYNIVYDREDNSLLTTAQYLTPPTRVIGTLNSPADGAEYDHYSVYLEAGQTLYVIAIGDLMGSSLDGYMYILNSSGSQMAVNNDMAAPLRDPFLNYTATANGLYYIRLTSTGGTYGRTGHYELFVEVK